MIIIPIGIDCGIADYLRSRNLRKFALPFDWCVTYQGVANVIKNDFCDFLPIEHSTFSSISSTSFVHNTFPNDIETIQRRIQRFKDILNSTTDEIIFFRKGHAFHNHEEATRFHTSIKNDIIDCEELSCILKSLYPTLRFKIIVTLVCHTCFDPMVVYTSKIDNISIYPLITSTVHFDTSRFDNILASIIPSPF